MESIDILKFGAVWCAPCKLIESVIESCIKDVKGISYQAYDFDKDVDVFSQYNITSVPVVIIKKNGEEVERLHGAFTKPLFLAKLKRYTDG